MKTKIPFLLFLSLFIISCDGNETNEPANKAFNKEKRAAVTQKRERYNDSVNKLSQILNDISEKRMTTKEAVSNLTESRDSLKLKLSIIENSITDIKDKEIETNIEEVSSKLAEIKQEKENLVEQTELKKEEIQLAVSKLEILKNEKKIYTKQKEKLYKKGAATEAFTEVNAKLDKINEKISAKNNLINKLNRNVAANNLEIKRLDNERTKFSDNIRKSYDAEKILNDYSKGEVGRLQKLILDYNTQIEKLSKKVNSLNSDYKALQSKNTNLKQEVSSTIEHVRNSDTEQTNPDLEKTQKKGNLNTALIVIIILFIATVILYRLGRKRKKSKHLNQ